MQSEKHYDPCYKYTKRQGDCVKMWEYGSCYLFKLGKGEPKGGELHHRTFIRCNILQSLGWVQKHTPQNPLITTSYHPNMLHWEDVNNLTWDCNPQINQVIRPVQRHSEPTTAVSCTLYTFPSSTDRQILHNLV